MNNIYDISLGKSIVIYNDNVRKDFKSCVNGLLVISDIEVSGLEGPYRLVLDFIEDRIKFEFFNKKDNSKVLFFPKIPFDRIIKDYSIIVDSYNERIRNSCSNKTEAIDLGRRSLHNEGAEILSHFLHEKVKMDFETSRKIFFLIYILYS